MADYKHCPIEKWTKEHVHAWLCETVQVKQKYADMFIEQEVSGECLLCFEKQDIIHMGIEYGPAIKIWSQLKKHKTLSDTEASSKQETPVKTSHTTEADVSTKTESPQPQPIPREDGGIQMANIFALLLDCLEDLSDKHFKKFRRYLKDPILNEGNTIPTSQLENKERTAIASLIIEYHGEEKALKTTISILKKIPRDDLVESLKKNTDQRQATNTDLKREETRETDEGEKLKNLLTCGASMLGHYSHFIVITNQCNPDQLQHLQFLCKLKLFCVLDFDPNSNTNGTCKLYRESRHANLHLPALFQGEPSVVIKNLNLNKQTSWVFCNGRLDLDAESSGHLDYQSWLRITHREIEQMVSFIFRPEVLPSRRWLVIFLLLSPVESEKDPIFDTFMTFHRQCGGEENIIHICKNEHIFQNWQNLIWRKYEFNLNKQSIYKLDLSQINGQIMKLGRSFQSEKLLPSADSSHVILQQKVCDRMTTLDILSANECENVQFENSSEFQNLKIEVEENFYRGGEVSWLNFYFSEKQKAKPFIKRDKYEAVMAMVTSQVKHPQSTCVLVNLFHHPGCGATTLAKHVMWDLRNQLRCAVLKENSSNEQVASQITDLMKHGKSDESPQTPVLLLVDNSKDTEAAEKLKNCIRRKLDENCPSKKGKDTSSLVIILNCVRTHFPKDQYKRCEGSQYITAELTKKEQDDFEEKLQELKENHKRPENFYSFMIMKSNFDKKYVKNVVSNILIVLDIGTKEARLLSFMALLNSYIASSDIPQSVCEDFLGMKTFLWGKETVLERMEPYSNLLIGSKGGQYEEYSAVRILHHDIACACLEELDSTYNMRSGDIVMDLLHCDLFFKSGPGKDALTLSIHRMLIERQRNVKNERNSQFSLLIEKVHKDEGRQKVTDIFMKASTRYEKSASIPQALARYLYLYDRDFSQALVWAERATKITENSFTVDTIGQIHKNDLKYKIQQEKEQEIARTPECLDIYLELAKKAVNAFQRAQKLAKTEYESYEDYQLTKDSYNQSADMGLIETALIVFETIRSLPFFEGEDPLTKMYLQTFLRGKTNIRNVYFEDNVINQKYVDVLKKHEQFVQGLKMKAKTSFECLDSYFTYLKTRKSDEELDHRCRRKVSKHFKKYLSFFSEAQWSQEQAGTGFLRENMDAQAREMFLEEQKADTFAGLLQHLERMNEETMEKITECYLFLHERSKSKSPKFKTNLILSNVILHVINPKSKFTMKEQDLVRLLREMMQEIGVQHSSPEPYYLALLLLWPNSSSQDIDENILLYVRAIHSSFRRQIPHSLRKRGTVSYFLLGAKSGLKKLVPKAKLYDTKESNRLWQTGEIFAQKHIKDRLLRVYGTVEEKEVYFEHNKHKIPVHPALLGAVRTGFSTERVSFYLGFSMAGPLAYDIRYEN